MFKARLCHLMIVALTALVSVAQFAGHADRNASPRSQYIIVYPTHLAKAAHKWAEYRASDGWHVTRLEVNHTDSRHDAGAQLQQHLRTQFAAHQAREQTGDFAVLLLGDVPQANTPGIATWHFEQRDPLLGADRKPQYMYATDHPYRLADDTDDVPDFALGRIPASSNAQALAALNKIKRYEQDASPGPWRQHLTFVAGEGHFGPADRLLEHLVKQLLTRFVPDVCTLSMTYAAPHSIYCPPADRVQETVLQRLREPALLFTYIGHGSAQALDDAILDNRAGTILNVNGVQQLRTDDPRRPIALLNCCSAGWFDLNGNQQSLAEAMLFNPAGPIAVIAGSRITHPYANTILQKKLTSHLLSGRIETLGRLDLLTDQAMYTTDAIDQQINTIALTIAAAMNWQTSLADLRSMHVRLYNLLGDPAMRLPAPPHTISDLQFNNNILTGRIDNMKRGTITVAIRTERDSFAEREQAAQRLHQSDNLTERTHYMYPLVNDRVLQRLGAPVRDGSFRVTLPDDVPPRGAVISVYAYGVDADGRIVDAAGALRPPH